MIRLYNSMKREIMDFIPQDPKRVTMYVCGPTVYASPHIGNMRSTVVYDILYRLLRHDYGADSVSYATNFTDVDDKIIENANSMGATIDDITNEVIEEYRLFSTRLNVLEPTFRPRATKYITDMIDMIIKLIGQGNAYFSYDGVYFHVPSSPAESFEGTRQEAGDSSDSPHKKDVRDFALWKLAKPGEPAWDSPWGLGRPGWHIECSAMIEKVLGETIDIHAGGADLRFPHHEAENRQSSAVHDGKPLANYWLHHAMVVANGSKMTKSRGNGLNMPLLLSMEPGEAIRLFLLMTHYRFQQVIRGSASLSDAKEILDMWYRIWLDLKHIELLDVAPHPSVLDALREDINTPNAITALHELSKEIKVASDKQMALSVFVASARFMGLMTYEPVAWFQAAPSINPKEIERLISERNAARAIKDWDKADSIRDQLSLNNILLRDTEDETFWFTAHGDVRHL